jgi:hypothetical protein
LNRKLGADARPARMLRKQECRVMSTREDYKEQWEAGLDECQKEESSRCFGDEAGDLYGEINAMIGETDMLSKGDTAVALEGLVIAMSGVIERSVDPYWAARMALACIEMADLNAEAETQMKARRETGYFETVHS